MPRRPGNLLLCAIASCVGACAAGPPVRVQTLSTRPAFVSGGDVLVGLDIPAGVDPARVRLALADRDVSDRIRPATDRDASAGHSHLAFIEDLPLGEALLQVTWPDRAFRTGHVALALTNHPAPGPVISGPHEQPFLCETERFTLQTGESLGPPTDEHCSVHRRVDYVYRNTMGALVPWPHEGSRPPDIAETTTSEGRRVPYIVRIETGTINRAIYQSALLHDPATPAPDPWRRSPGWNGRLVYTHGGGCRRGWHRQGTKAGALRGLFLERGYAVTSSSLNVFGQNCNDLVASETHMMVKERFIEAYGVPLHTIGIGGSGGSYQSLQTADNYPGIFDGIFITDSFPDVATGSVLAMSDARLLQHYFEVTAPSLFSSEQVLAVAGVPNLHSLAKHSDNAARIVAEPDRQAAQGYAAAEFPDGIAEHVRYHPRRNPRGVRATVFDHTANVYGRDGATGKALRTLDNGGVQYGLAALNAGSIDFERFLDLNARIGGFDDDGRIVSARSVASEHAVLRAHATGRVLSARGGLSNTPVLDFREYRDDSPDGEFHFYVHSFAPRARMQAANGHHDNHVMVVVPDETVTVPEGDGRIDAAVLRERAIDAADRERIMPYFEALDIWLTAIKRDTTAQPAVAKMRRARPAELVDHCLRLDPEGRRVPIREALSARPQGRSRCGELYPVHFTPRQLAGAPISNDVLICQRKPIDLSDYRIPLPVDALARLRVVFPQGVCDYTRPGLHSGYDGPWQRLPATVN